MTQSRKGLHTQFTLAKRSQFYIFGDQSWPVESLADTLPTESAVTAWIDGKGWISNPPVTSLIPSTIKSRQLPVTRALNAAQNLPEHFGDEEDETVAIVGFEDQDVSRKVVEYLRTRGKGMKILEVGSRAKRAASLLHPQRSVAWQDIISGSVERQIHLLSFQKRVQKLRACLKDADEVAILLQDDPDPDGLASALALRKILNRNSQTAPIVSFGKITRPENVAMSRLLGIDVVTVNSEKLAGFEKIVLVDCQPSFFKGRKIPADVVLDHHPRVAYSDVSTKPLQFEEIREELGALSSLMLQYLLAAGCEISQRLATALIYGIKSDTLLLNREVSEFDLAAFVDLYPLMNGNLLRRIERPELPLGYLECLRSGLKNMQVREGLVVLPLGNVDREEWIAQAADFALQVEGSQWAMGCGVVDGRVVISGRNCGYVQHCGDVFKELFDKMGCAGGHRTMAKGIISVSNWRKHYKTTSASAMATTLWELIFEAAPRGA